ncbi:S1 family peptidase [Spirillospora sp. NPDC127200]
MLRSLLTFAGALAALTVAASSPASAAVTYDVRGGDAFTVQPAAGRCTVGFPVRGGYVTSAQCGRTGQTVYGHNGVAQGTLQGAAFPNRGLAWVRTNTNWRPRGLVNKHDGTFMNVRGAQPVPIGTTVCMSGAVSGWRCGVLQARNLTVNFPEGAVFGVMRTSICAAPGDLGSPLIANGQAQGVLIAASTGGGCASYFLPISEALAAYGLSLLTE